MAADSASRGRPSTRCRPTSIATGWRAFCRTSGASWAHKLTAEVLHVIEEARAAEGGLDGPALVEFVRQRSSSSSIGAPWSARWVESRKKNSGDHPASQGRRAGRRLRSPGQGSCNATQPIGARTPPDAPGHGGLDGACGRSPRVARRAALDSDRAEPRIRQDLRGFVTSLVAIALEEPA